MEVLQKGFDLLGAAKFAEANEFFSTTLTVFKIGCPTHTISLFGKARALIGLSQDLDQAEAILRDLINRQPTWVNPYMALADLYESTQRVNKADRLYLDALNCTERSDYLTKKYENFLRRHFAPWEQPAITPGYANVVQQAAATTSSEARVIAGKLPTP